MTGGRGFSVGPSFGDYVRILKDDVFKMHKSFAAFLRVSVTGVIFLAGVASIEQFFFVKSEYDEFLHKKSQSIPKEPRNIPTATLEKIDELVLSDLDKELLLNKADRLKRIDTLLSK
jgi:hypothetical protein